MSLLSVRHVAVLVGLLGATGWAQTFESLYHFPADRSDGVDPVATLTLGPGGDLYGTTTEGGANDDGTIFKVSPSSTIPAQRVTILDHFDEASSGRNSRARLQYIDGYLYGATFSNEGLAGKPAGSVFKYHPEEGFSVLFPILPRTVGERIPRNPVALTLGEPNMLYVACYDPTGIWRVPLDGSPAEIAYLFNDVKDEGIFATSLIRGIDGNLYGGTYGGGQELSGSFFRINLEETGATFTQLFSASEKIDGPEETGYEPRGALVQAPDGNFYGTMEDAGPGNTNGCVFRLTPDGEYTVIYSFTARNDLRYPAGDLTIASDGMLYGTAQGGGVKGYGGVFRVKTNGTGYKILHTFSKTDGRTPVGGVVQAADGHIYGTTQGGGEGDNGTVFRIKLNLPPPPVNRAPVALDDVGVTSGEAVTINVLANDFDPDEDPLTVTIAQAPAAGTAVVLANGSIRYTPGEAYNGSDAFSYTVKDGRGGTSTASVTISDEEFGPLLQAGLYNGLLLRDPELSGNGDLPRGQFLVSVTASGQFTGVLYTQRKRVPFRGEFEDDGTAVAALRLPGKKAGILFLSFQATNPRTMVGFLFGPEIWSGFASRAKESESDIREYFTVQLKANAAVAAGHGYGIMRVLPNGLVGIVGKLGDGSRLSTATTLVSGSENTTGILFFTEPTPGGAFAGSMAAAPEAQTYVGMARWFRPPTSKPSRPYSLGFLGDIEVTAARYTVPSRTEPVLDLEGGIVKLAGGAAEGEFVLDGAKVRTLSPLRGLSFNRKTGLFGGKMEVEGRMFRFQGVVNQSAKTGVGQFIFNRETRAVDLAPITLLP